MPLHVDVHVNNDHVKRFHIARMSKNGLSDTSVNEYSVVDSEKEPHYNDTHSYSTFPQEPTWLEWEEGNRFLHTYGDDILVCVHKAITELLPVEDRVRILEAELIKARQKNG